jgi:molybdate transport system substrate-binding protein
LATCPTFIPLNAARVACRTSRQRERDHPHHAGRNKSCSWTENVRLTLRLVARGEAPLGIVYDTDAKIEPAVKVIGVFPDNSNDPIIYPVALTADAKPDAAQYLSFLCSQTAKSIFESYGFNFLVKPTW